ncbi:hypothetical protein RHGRI_021399 [Rhododendron griersonianum]|uniref:Cytochrome P450 n=1 Tax=Rhododendron griersonianum TaxID=479676 RepID=A0AAV6JP05_9ERIC|nr:hypothetical protein RHGRI_021399 [Rhododendron griersonianum]
MGWELLVSVVCMLLMWAVWTINKRRRGRHHVEEIRVLPPGPRRWPLVGNILQLSWPPHESFARLACEHGPIMTLWLGSMGTVLISSDKVARDMFKIHDVVLARRKTYEAIKGGFGTDGSIIMAQYGPEWRTLRRLCTTEFFVTSRLDATQGVFQIAIQLRRKETSKDLLDPNSEIGGEFFFHTGKVLELVTKPNFADFLPILRRFDPQGIRRKTQFHLERVLEITGGFIRERMEARGGDCEEEEERSRDYMDVLLEHRVDGVEGPLCFSSASIDQCHCFSKCILFHERV